MKRLEATVTGRVQGVGYRNFVWKTARELGLTGYVKNQADGSVYVIAEGDVAVLQDLIVAMRRGPILARVDDIHEDLAPATGEFSGFDVRY